MKIKTNKRVFALLILAVVSLISVAAVGSAVTILSDGFDDGDLSGWTLTPDGAGNNWIASTSFKSEGTHSALLQPSADNSNTNPAVLSRTISTVGYNNIVLSYHRKLFGLDISQDDLFNVSYSTNSGSTWTNVELNDNADDANYVIKTFSLDPAVNNNPNFVIRFECTLNNDEEHCSVDSFSLAGTQISSELQITVDTPTVRFGQNATIDVTNNGNSDFTQVTMSSLTNSFGTVSFLPTSFPLNHGQTRQDIVVILDKLIAANLDFGNNAIDIKADAGNGITSTATINVQKGFCSNGPQGGNLSIENFEITNEGNGDDDRWELLDEIEVEFDVENVNNDNDVNDVFVELALYDDQGNDQADELDFDEDDEELDIGDIDEGEEETVRFKFRVPADFDTVNYKLAVKAYSDDAGESEECTDVFDSNKLFEEISIDSVDEDEDEGKLIAFEDTIISPLEATCGDLVTLSTDVFNIGGSDQEQVRVNLVNSEFGIDQFVEIRDEMQTGDRELVNFDFVIPQNAENKIYSLRLSADYEYDNGDYEQSTDEDTLVPLTVLGCAGGDGGDDGNGEDNIADIDADLDSEAVAGKELVVRATITNLGNEDATFAISALDYQSWAELESISERVVDIDAGDSQEVVFTFTINDDVEGEQTFTIETSSTLGTESREVAVNVEGATGDFDGFDFGNNSLLWIIGIVNIVLIILIIIVAVRVSRR